MTTEHEEQTALIAWARMTAPHLPGLELLHAIPNGGWRHKATGARLKKEGLKRGVPDLCLPVARGKYHGLYVELKSMTGRVTAHQRWWLDRLTEQGYLAVVCKGFAQAVDVITGYLSVAETPETDQEIAIGVAASRKLRMEAWE